MLRNFRKLFPNLLGTIFFNYKSLPINQAVKLPIWVKRGRFVNVSGKVRIEAEEIKSGMITLGFDVTKVSQKGHFIIENRGEIVFRGGAILGTSGSICVGECGVLVVGKDAIISDNPRIICYDRVELGNGLSVSWNVSISDYDFHAMKNAYTERMVKPYAPVIIGDNNWIGHDAIIQKGTKTPEYVTISAGSVTNGKYKCEPKSIISGNPAEIVSEGCYYMDRADSYYPIKK